MSDLNNPPAVCVIYLRTRLSESKRRPASLARQRQTLEKWQLTHAELPVLAEYVDLETHNNLLHTDFQRLLVDARLKKFSNVAIERVQCLAQDGSELKQVVTELTALGVRLHLANEPGINLTDFDDLLSLSCRMTLANHEIARLKAKRGRHA